MLSVKGVADDMCGFAPYRAQNQYGGCFLSIRRWMQAAVHQRDFAEQGHGV